MWLLLPAAWADAIQPGPMVCPPGFGRVVRDHAEVCAFDPLTLALEGGGLLVLGAIVVGIALFVKR